jgi:hypothetical protein
MLAKLYLEAGESAQAARLLESATKSEALDETARERFRSWLATLGQ